MRITADQARLITDRVARDFGADAAVWLFGSRVDFCVAHYPAADT